MQSVWIASRFGKSKSSRQLTNGTSSQRQEKSLIVIAIRLVRKTGRRGGIRTRDPLHPMQVRYQAALHAEAIDYSRRTVLSYWRWPAGQRYSKPSS
jgi:hypothetical protein